MGKGRDRKLYTILNSNIYKAPPPLHKNKNAKGLFASISEKTFFSSPGLLPRVSFYGFL